MVKRRRRNKINGSRLKKHIGKKIRAFKGQRKMLKTFNKKLKINIRKVRLDQRKIESLRFEREKLKIRTEQKLRALRRPYLRGFKPFVTFRKIR